MARASELRESQLRLNDFLEHNPNGFSDLGQPEQLADLQQQMSQASKSLSGTLCFGSAYSMSCNLYIRVYITIQYVLACVVTCADALLKHEVSALALERKQSQAALETFIQCNPDFVNDQSQLSEKLKLEARVAELLQSTVATSGSLKNCINTCYIV